MKYRWKFGHTLGRIQKITLMIIIGISYTICCIATETVSSTLPGFQSIKCCVQYLVSHPHKLIVSPYNSYYGSNLIRLTWSGNQVEDWTTHNCLECHKDKYDAIIIIIRRSVSGIINNLIGVAVWWKVQIQPDISSNSTDV